MYPSWHASSALVLDPPEKWDDTTSCRDWLGPCALCSATHNRKLFTTPTSQAPSQAPSPAGGGWGLDNRSEHTDRTSHPHAANAAAVVLKAGVVRSPRGHRAVGGDVSGFRKAGGGPVLWPRRGGGHGPITHRTGAPRSYPAPNTQRAKTEERFALGRDSRPDEQGKLALARRC